MKSYRRTVARAAVASLVVFGVGACVSDGGSAANKDFYGMFSAIDVDYETSDTIESLAASSDLVGVGEIVSIRQGRTLGGEHGARGTLATAVANVRLSETVRGTAPGSVVQVELYRPPSAKIADLDAAAPDGEVLVFLKDVATLAPPAKADYSGVENNGRPLYTLTTQQGWMVEDGDDVRTPFDESGGRETFRSQLDDAGSLDAVARRARTT